MRGAIQRVFVLMTGAHAPQQAHTPLKLSRTQQNSSFLEAPRSLLRSNEVPAEAPKTGTRILDAEMRGATQ